MFFLYFQPKPSNVYCSFLSGSPCAGQTEHGSAQHFEHTTPVLGRTGGSGICCRASVSVFKISKPLFSSQNPPYCVHSKGDPEYVPSTCHKVLFHFCCRNGTVLQENKNSSTKPKSEREGYKQRKKYFFPFRGKGKQNVKNVSLKNSRKKYPKSQPPQRSEREKRKHTHMHTQRKRKEHNNPHLNTDKWLAN